MKRKAKKQAPPQTAPEETTLRLDQWLWRTRFFKTRRLAIDAVNAGHARLNGGSAKAARPVKIGDWITVRKNIFEWEVEVLGIPARRGPAKEAVTHYRESEESQAARQRMSELRRLQPVIEIERGAGRPTKRDRRAMNRIKGR